MVVQSDGKGCPVVDEYVIICRDYRDLDFIFRQFLNTVPKNTIRKVHKDLPTRPAVELNLQTETVVRFMTKSYFESMFTHGFRGKTFSSKQLEKKLSEVKKKTRRNTNGHGGL